MTNLAPLGSLISSGSSTLAPATIEGSALQFDTILNQQLANPSESAAPEAKTRIAVAESNTQTVKPESSLTAKTSVEQANQVTKLPEQSPAIVSALIAAAESAKISEFPVAKGLTDLNTTNTEASLSGIAQPLNTIVDSAAKPDLFELITNIKSPLASVPNTDTTNSVATDFESVKISPAFVTTQTTTLKDQLIAEAKRSNQELKADKTQETDKNLNADETVNQSAQISPDSSVVALLNASLIQSNTAQPQATEATAIQKQTTDNTSVIAHLNANLPQSSTAQPQASQATVIQAQDTDKTSVITHLNASLPQSSTAQPQASQATAIQAQAANKTSILTDELDKITKTPENAAITSAKPTSALPINSEKPDQPLKQTDPIPATEARPQASANLITSGNELITKIDSNPGNSKTPDAISATPNQANALNALDTAPIVNAAVSGNAEITAFSNVGKQSQAQYPINTHYQQAGWSEEIGNRLVWMANQNIQSAQLSVNPENLGSIQIQIQIDANKVANIMFFSPQAEVRQALENSMSSLGQLFNESGISLGQTNVGSQASQQQFQQQTRLNYSAQEDLIETPTSATTPIQGNGLINTTA